MKTNIWGALLRIAIAPAIAMLLVSGCKKSGKTGTDPDGPEKPAVVPDTSSANPLADMAIEGYNNTFLVSMGTTQYYKESLSVTTKDYFWCQALDIQMLEDTYLRTKKTEHRTLISNLLNTFLVQNAGNRGQQDWDWNDYNDDLLWAGIAFARGYQITGNSVFLAQAEYAFDRMYNRGWDSALGGGIWWDVAHANKSGLSNNPAVILACDLYESTGRQDYLTKAQAIYDWVRRTLFNSTTGAVYENIKPDGTLDRADNVYNSGAFISAANHLHLLTGNQSLFNDAKLAADYVVNNKTVGGVLSSGQREGTWQSEFARGLGEFVRDNNLWDTYYTWMRSNADAAWNARRTDKNVSWNKWQERTPSDNTVRAVECASAVVMLQVTPAKKPGFSDGGTYRFTPKMNKESAMSVSGAGTSDGTAVELSGWTGAAGQKFKVVSAGYGYYRLAPSNVPAKSVFVAGTAEGSEVQITAQADLPAQYWKLVYDYSGFYKLKPKSAPVSCLKVSGNTGQNGSKCVISPENNDDKERWFLE